MSGHSKWATTKHKKAAIDAKRAKAFAKFIKAIEVAARMGGADIAGNPALDLAVSKAKKNSVPNDNIDRAIKRGVRLAVTRNGGTMADQGSVAFLFERKGVAEVTKTDGLTEDDVLMAVLDAGAEEVLDEGDIFTVVSAATDLPEIRKALDEAGLEYNNDDPVFRPTMQVDLDAEGAKKFLKLADAIEELDDVQNVYSNANVSDEVMAELEAE